MLELACVYMMIGTNCHDSSSVNLCSGRRYVGVSTKTWQALADQSMINKQQQKQQQTNSKQRKMDEIRQIRMKKEESRKK